MPCSPYLRLRGYPPLWCYIGTSPQAAAHALRSRNSLKHALRVGFTLTSQTSGLPVLWRIVVASLWWIHAIASKLWTLACDGLGQQHNPACICRIYISPMNAIYQDLISDHLAGTRDIWCC